MATMLWKSADFLKIAAVVGAVSILALLALALHAAWPMAFIVGATGRGVAANLEHDIALQQEVISPVEFTNTLFVAIDTPDRAKDIQASLIASDTESPLMLGSGRTATFTIDGKKALGGTWRLSQLLEPDTTYTVQLTLASSAAQPVELAADEVSESSSNAAVLRLSNGAPQRQNFTLAVGFVAQQPRWSTAAPQEQQEYMQAARAIVAGVVIILVLAALGMFVPKRLRESHIIVFALLVLAITGAIAGRLWFASHLPLVNDEQFYIYDALLYNPYDAQFWKTPLLITALAGWTSVVGVHSLLAIRLLVIVTSVGALGLLAYVAYRLAGKTAGWTTLILGFFLPVVMSYTSLVMTEQFMLIFVLAAVALTIVVRNKEKITWWQLLLISLLLGLATAVRWSALFWLVAVVVLLRHHSLKEFSRRLLWLAVPYIIGTGLFLALFPDILPKFQVGGIFLEFFERSQAQGWVAKFLSWREPLARVSPLIFLGLIALNGPSQKRKVVYAAVVIAFMLLLFPAWREAPTLPDYPLFANAFFYLVVLFTVAGIVVSGHYKPRLLLDAVVLFVPPLMAYAIFHKVNPKYLAESMPALVLLAGLGLAAIVQALWQRRSLAAAVCLLVFAWLLPPWILHPLSNPYAGTISVSAFKESVEYLKTHVGENERVLTASSLIPLMADKEPAYPISHPSWLEPTFRGEPDPRYEALWGPIANDVEAGDIQWVVDEKLTTDTYRRHPRINAAISSLYETVVEVGNGNSRPITILRLRP